MGAQESSVVEVQSITDVDQLLERLPELPHRNVIVKVDRDSTALRTAAEFSRLISSARRVGSTLTIDTNDQLRSELARMLGWSVLGASEEPIATPDSMTRPIPFGPPSPVDHAPSTTKDQPHGDYPDREKSSQARTQTIVLPEAISMQAVRDASVTQQEEDAHRQVRLQLAAKATVLWRRLLAALPSPATADDRRKWSRTGVIAGSLLGLLLLAGILYLLVPSATVTLVPTEHAITADLTYGVAAPDANYDIVIEPTPVSNTSVFDKTIPTTGERFEPDGTASGQVLLTNPQTVPISIPAGTTLTGKNRQPYRTQGNVTVPASDPFGSLSFGSASVGIVAGNAGPAANADPGRVSGRLDNGVFYTNRDAVGGGTQKRIPVVAEADLAALAEAAQQDLGGRAEQEFMDKLGSGMKLVPESLTMGKPALAFNHEARQDATEVAVHATLEVTGLAFDPAKLQEQARDEAGRRLASHGGPDTILLGDAVQLTNPTPLNDQQTAYSIHATAIARSVISEEQRDRLASTLAGVPLDESQPVLDRLKNVADYQVHLSPSWLPQRFPLLASRIHVVLADKERINDQQ